MKFVPCTQLHYTAAFHISIRLSDVVNEITCFTIYSKHCMGSMVSSTTSSLGMRRTYCLVLLIALVNNFSYGFIPRSKPYVLLKVEQTIKPFTTSHLPPTLEAASSSEIGAKLKATNTAIVTGESTEPKPLDGFAWRGVVLGICVVWSTNFAVIKEIFHAVPSIDPSLYAAIRFSLAGLVMLPRALNNLKNTELIISSMTIGLSVFFGYFGQAVGLMTTTANKSAFICSLNVVCVALLSSLIKKEFKIQTWISSFLAVLGVAVLESDATSPPVIGDIWSLCQPVGFGFGYVFLEYLVAKFPDNPGAITSFKILSIAIASIVWAAAAGHTFADLQPILESNIAIGGLLYTGTPRPPSTKSFFLQINSLRED